MPSVDEMKRNQALLIDYALAKLEDFYHTKRVLDRMATGLESHGPGAYAIKRELLRIRVRAKLLEEALA